MMSAVTANSAGLAPARMSAPVSDALVTLAITLFLFVTYALSGFPTLASAGGDNDSLLRLVQVRDLLGGQGWFDLHQYRMGADGGFVMHWSRLIDAPLVAMMWLGQAVGLSVPIAEAAAVTLYPALLMWAALFGLVQLARTLGDEHAIFPAITIGAGALYFMGIFRPGSIDHHNAQITLTIFMMVFLIRAPGNRLFAPLAGVCAAVMLAIGMETAPYVAFAGACVALCYLFRGREEAMRTAAFGLSFAGATLVAFVATVSPSNWAQPYCDTLSSVQLALASTGGAGLALAVLVPGFGSTFVRRLIALVAVGAACAVLARVAFPQCLADPYAGFVDQRMREMWLNHVTEAQSIVDLLLFDWTKVLIYYFTPAVALVITAWLLLRDGADRGRLIYAAFLFATYVVSCWQLRGAAFAIPLASTALALAIGLLRARVVERPTVVRNITLLLAWTLSVNLVWSVIGNALHTANAAQAELNALSEGDVPVDCAANANFARLATWTRGKVLAVSDLGSPILANTPHHVLAGPYHRNMDSNRVSIDIFTATPEQALGMIRAHNIDYVAFCLGNPETVTYSGYADNGLMAALRANTIPAWLDGDADNKSQPLKIFKVLK